MGERPNIVLLTIDSLRADKTGATGGESFTPNLDRLGRAGVEYTEAVAPGPSTYETMPAIWTGEPMGRLADAAEIDSTNVNSWTETHLERPTFPERLRELGYHLGAFTANPHTVRGSGFHRGFHDYEDFMDESSNPLQRWMARRPYVSKFNHLLTVMQRDRAALPWTAYREGVQSWLEDARTPYFLWVFVLEPHTPYLPLRENRRASWPAMVARNMLYWLDAEGALEPDPATMLELYEDAIRDADDFVGWLAEQVGEDTRIVVHSDHGEGFGDLDHGAWGHKGTLYEENVHVPLVVGNADATDTVERPTSLVSVHDILLDLATGEYEPGRYADRYALSRTFRPGRIAVRNRDRKVIADVSDGSLSGPSEHHIAAGTDRPRTEPTEFADVAEGLARRRLTHERERSAVRTATRGLPLGRL